LSFKRRSRLRETIIVASLLVAMQSGLEPAAANELAWETFNDAGDSFVKQQKFAEAEEILGMAINAAREMKSNDRLKTSLNLMAQVYDGLKQPEKAAAVRQELTALGGIAAPAAASARDSSAGESSASAASASAPASAATSVAAKPGETARAAKRDDDEDEDEDDDDREKDGRSAPTSKKSGSSDAFADASQAGNPAATTDGAAPASYGSYEDGVNKFSEKGQGGSSDASSADADVSSAKPAGSGLPSSATESSDADSQSDAPMKNGKPENLQEIKGETEVDKLIRQLTNERAGLHNSDSNSGGSSATAQRNSTSSASSTSGSKSPDGEQIASSLPPVAASGTIVNATEVRQLHGPFDFATSICMTPDASFAVTGGGDQLARYWDIAGGKELAQCAGHKGNVNAVSLSRDGLRILTGGDDATVRLFSTTGVQEKVFSGHKNNVLCVAFSPDMKRAASGSFDAAIIIWDLESGAQIGTLSGHSGPVRSVIFSPSGDKIISASDDHSVMIWDAAGMKPINKLKGHSDYVLTLDVSDDGQRILSGGRDLNVRLWDMDGNQIHVLQGHKNWVQRVRFMKGGNQAMTGSLDKTVRIWDLSSGALQTTAEGFEWGLWAEDFAPDRMQVLTGSNDKTIRVWSLPN
jgi:WD40 repeat protein